MMNPQAEELNKTIEQSHPAIINLLSERGKKIFFPKSGIMAQTAEAKGKKINASIGAAVEADGTPMRLESIAANINLPPEAVFPYAASFGRPELRQSWKTMLVEKNPALQSEYSLPVVTSALTHGLTLAGYLFINPDDEVIMPDYFWGNYKLSFQVGFDANFKTFPTFADGGFNVQGLRESLQGPGKKIVILNFPNNPTGYNILETEVAPIVEAIRESGESGNPTLVILDDAYFGLSYENGVNNESLFSHLANLHKNVLTLKLDGVTKEDYAWGLRIGFMTYGIKGGTKDLYAALESKTGGAVRGTVSNAAHHSQSLLLKAFSSPSYKQEKADKLKLLIERYQEVKRVLQDPKFTEIFTPLPYNSGYFMCVELQDGIDAEQVRQLLLQKYDTGVITMGNLMRLAYASVAKENIEQLFENIYAACKEVQS